MTIDLTPERALELLREVVAEITALALVGSEDDD